MSCGCGIWCIPVIAECEREGKRTRRQSYPQLQTEFKTRAQPRLLEMLSVDVHVHMLAHMQRLTTVHLFLTQALSLSLVLSNWMGQ